MAPVKAVVFDMYETLVTNPEGSWIGVFGEICQTQGLGVDPEVLFRGWKALEVQFRRTRLNLEEPEKSPPFKSYEEAWRGCFEEVFGQMSLAGDPGKAARMAVVSLGRQDPFDEVPKAIMDIQDRWTTAVLSNADDDYLLPQLERLNMQFSLVLSSEMVRAYKPHPRPFRTVLERLGVEAVEAVYVGDNLFDDVKGAKGVGMGTVWINRHGKVLDDGLPSPDHQVANLSELPQILERWDQWS